MCKYGKWQFKQIAKEPIERARGLHNSRHSLMSLQKLMQFIMQPYAHITLGMKHWVFLWNTECQWEQNLKMYWAIAELKRPRDRIWSGDESRTGTRFCPRFRFLTRSCSCSRSRPCSQTDRQTDRQTDSKQTVSMIVCLLFSWAAHMLVHVNANNLFFLQEKHCRKEDVVVY